MEASRNPGIRGFAEMMLRDHAKSTAMVKSAALQARLKVSAPRLTAQQSHSLARLRATRGPARDRLYVDQQKRAHAEALAVQQDYAANGRVPTLKAAAGKIVPVVRHHIAMLGGL
jgi:putative membrane protein